MARSLGIPILPFVKRLKHVSGLPNEDAIRRDEFRKEVQDWKNGFFRAEFDLALDLGEKVRKALLSVFENSFLKREVRQVEKRHSAQLTRESIEPPAPIGSPVGGTILIAGAGLSLAAGYPSAATLCEILGQRLNLSLAGPDMLARHSLADIASYAETHLGRDGLVATISEVLDTPTEVRPTTAHLIAVQRYPAIVTTNYDVLFERACEQLGIATEVITPRDGRSKSNASVKIYKADGSIDRPITLRITHEDHQQRGDQAEFWREIDDLTANNGILVFGHSLRDETAQRIMDGRNRNLTGTYVTPFHDELEAIRLHRHKLKILMVETPLSYWEEQQA